jgi:uncharacterized protein YjhX (UPF0386 family)
MSRKNIIDNGRPMVYVIPVMAKINIRTKDIEKVARLQCTPREAAAFLGIRLHQFKSLLAKDEGVQRAWERGQMMGRVSLRRKQFRLAGSNASMAQFLGKQILGQRDIVTQEHTGDVGLEIDASKLSQKERDAVRKALVKSSEPSKDAG